MANGHVVAVCKGPGGIPKHPVDEARVDADGLEGDAHRFHLHGGRDRAVCLFFLSDYASLQADGVSCEPPGAFGENLTLDGLDPTLLRAGDRLRVGDEVRLEIHSHSLIESDCDCAIQHLGVWRGSCAGRCQGAPPTALHLVLDSPII